MKRDIWENAWRLARRVCNKSMDEGEAYRIGWDNGVRIEHSSVAFRVMSSRIFNNADMKREQRRLAYAEVDCLARRKADGRP